MFQQVPRHAFQLTPGLLGRVTHVAAELLGRKGDVDAIEREVVGSGCCAAALYGLCRLTVLRAENAYWRAKVSFPVIVGATFAINSCYWIVKGTKGQPERFGTAGLVREAKAGNLVPTIVIGCYVGLAAAACAGGWVIAAASRVTRRPTWRAGAVCRSRRVAAARAACWLPTRHVGFCSSCWWGTRAAELSELSPRVAAAGCLSRSGRDRAAC